MTTITSNLIAIGQAYIELSTQCGKPMPSIEEVKTHLYRSMPADAKYIDSRPHMVTAIQSLKGRYYK